MTFSFVSLEKDIICKCAEEGFFDSAFTCVIVAMNPHSPQYNNPEAYMPYVPYCPGQSRILILCPGVPEIMKLSRKFKK